MTRNNVLRFLAYAALAIPALPPSVIPVFEPYTFGKTTLFMIIAEAMFFVWGTSALLKQKEEKPSHGAIAAIPATALLCVSAFSIAAMFGIRPLESFWGSSARGDGLFPILHFFAFFFVLTRAFPSETLMLPFLRFAAGIGVCTALYGIAQWTGLGIIAQSSGEIFSTLGNPAYFALYLLFSIFSAAWCARKAQRRETAIAWLCAAALGVIALFLTQVQAGTLALLLGAGIYAYPFLIRRISLTHALAMAAGGVIFIFLLVSSGNFEKLTDSPFADGSSLKNRFAVWAIAADAAFEKPLFGYGQNTFERIYLAHKTAGWTVPATEETFDKPHNAFLEIAIGFGALGLIAYILFIIALIRGINAWKDRDDRRMLYGMFAAYLSFLFFFFDTMPSLLMFFFLAAFIHAKNTENETVMARTETSAAPSGRANIVTVSAASVLLAGSFFLFHFAPLYSAYFANKFLSRAYGEDTIDREWKENALRYPSYNTPFIARAIEMAEREHDK